MRPQAVVSAIIGMLVLIMAFSSFYTVQPQETAIITRMGAIIASTEAPGLHFKMPFIDTANMMPISIQEISPKKSANTYTVDNQEVDVEYNIFYRIPILRASYVFTNVPDYQQRLLVMANDRIKSVMGQVNIQQLAEKRGEIRDEIKKTITHDAASLGLEVTDFQLSNLTYDAGFRHAVAGAAVQKANIEALEYRRQQSEKTAEMQKIIARGEANAVREKAQGTADSRLITATAEAQAIERIGMAQAAAIEAKAKALKASPEMIEYTKADRWDGKLPTAIYAGTPIPFLNMK